MLLNWLFFLFIPSYTVTAFPAPHLVLEQTAVSGDDGFEHPVGWIDPRIHGGRLLDFTTPKFGEPLNVIISAMSDPFILTEPGLHFYAKSIGFSEECLGLHYGNIHDADLGDGDGRKPEQYLARQFYFPVWGTCWESIAGGNHFRAWKQNGTMANSGAWFLGVSKEKDSVRHHDIVPNGYNRGRDWLVKRAVSGSSWQGLLWKADVEWREDLLKPGKEGVNHGISQDGRIAVLTVHRRASVPTWFQPIFEYFSFPSHHGDVMTAFLADLVHIFLHSLDD